MEEGTKQMTAVEKAKKAMSTPLSPSKLQDSDFVSTGITLLNLSTYGRVFGGLCKGKIYRVIGKSQSAKSFLCRTILAEAANNKNFDNHELIHDDIERGVLLDNVKFFGQKTANRLRAPAYTKNKVPIFSSTVMSFYQKAGEKLKKGIPFIWVVDSQDSLKSEGTTKMGDGKAKVHSDQMRQLIDGMEATGSILILVHHAKVNLGFTWGGDVTTGGASPEFYSSVDIRLVKLKSLKKTIKDHKFAIGNQILAHVTKNRITGLDRTIKFPLLLEIGIDDIGACVEYLIEYSHWPKEKGVVTADELDYEGPVSGLVKAIEKANWERELRVLTGKVWKGFEDACSLKRKSRYV